MLLPRLNSCCGCLSLREGVLVLGIVFTENQNKTKQNMQAADLILGIFSPAKLTSSTVIVVGFYVIHLTDPQCTTKLLEHSKDRRAEKLRAYLCAAIFSASLTLLVSAALIAGAVRRDAQLLLPWLFTVSIIGSCIFLYGFHIAMVKMINHFGEACVSIVILIVSEALPCYMFLLVYSFYHELRLESKNPAVHKNIYSSLHV